MNLKGFHVVFILVATLTVFGFGAWGIAEGRSTSDVGMVLMGATSTVAGVALLSYGGWFLRKLRGLES